MKKLVEKIIYILLIMCLLVGHSEKFISYAIENFEDGKQVVEKYENIELPTTDIDIELSEKTLYTLEENKVDFTLVLKNVSDQNELFENPRIEIELPEEIEFINIDKIMVLYKNGLSLSKWDVVENENGIKLLNIELEGKQENYQDVSIIDGTNIIIKTTIKPYDTTPIKKSSLKLRYENSGKNIIYKQQGKDFEEYPIQFMSRYGLLTLSQIENENIENSKELVIGEEIKSINLNMDSESQILNYNMSIINNYPESLENVEILGNFPIENNEKLLSKDLTNTFTSMVLAPIETTGVENKIYYSNEIDPASDSTSWTENFNDLEMISSYKIEIPKLNPEEILKFNYKTEVPENLSYNQSIYSNYKVNYNYDNQNISNESIIGAKTETKSVTYDKCQIKQETNLLNVGIFSTQAGKPLESEKEVHEGQIIDYFIVLTNTANIPLENIVLDANVINGNFYELKENYAIEGDETSKYYLYEENKEKTNEVLLIEKLEEGQTQIIPYSAVIRNKSENNLNTFSNVKIFIGEENIFENTSIQNPIKESKLNVRIAYSNNEENVDMSETVSRCALILNNLTNELIKEIIVDLEFSNPVELVEILMELTDIKYEILEQKIEDGKTKIKLKIFDIVPGESYFGIPVNLGNMDENVTEQEMLVTGSYNIENDEYYMNNYKRIIHQKNTEVTGHLLSDIEKEELENSDEITYTFSFENSGSIPMEADLLFTSDLGLNVKNYKLLKNDENIETKDNVESNIFGTIVNLEANEKAKLVVSANVDTQEVPDDQEDISARVSVNSYNLEKEFFSNQISYQLHKEIVEEKEIASTNNQPINSEIIENTNISIPENTNIPMQENDNIPIPENNISKAQENVPISENAQITENISNSEDKTEQNNNNEQNIKIEQSKNIQPAEEVKEKYTISGSIWLDENKNGLKDTDEPLLNDSKVKLYKATTQLEEESNLVATVKSEQGKYSFKDLEKDKYIVVFEYDENLYDITSYDQNDSILENSSAIQKNINSKNVAVTNIVNVEESNISKLNLGVYPKENFDLKIEKNISSVTIKNEKENVTKNYTNQKLIKEEIDPKYLKGTEVTIVYNISVFNIGDVPGYANKIIDYVPNGLEFNKKNNQDWYLENDVLCNTSLSDMEIKPGEKKELKLVLTKIMNDENTGVFKNESEIKVSTNSKNIKDNNISNNKDEVTIILSIKTGKIILYIMLVLIDLMILVIGIWEIKKRVL